MGSLSQERELTSISEGGSTCYPLYQGKGEGLEEVTTCDLGCSLGVVNNGDSLLQGREIWSALA